MIVNRSAILKSLQNEVPLRGGKSLYISRGTSNYPAAVTCVRPKSGIGSF